MAKIKNYCKITQTGKVTKNAKITENGKVTPNVKVNKKKNKKNTDILKKKSILFINDSCHDQESNDSKSADEVELETNIKQEEGNSSNDEVVEEKIYHEDIHKVNGIEKSAAKMDSNINDVKMTNVDEDAEEYEFLNLSEDAKLRTVSVSNFKSDYIAFVTFKDRKSVESALKLDRSNYSSKTIQVELCNYRNTHTPYCSTSLNNLSDEHKRLTVMVSNLKYIRKYRFHFKVYDLFLSCGPIVGLSKVVGDDFLIFLTFKEESGLEKALAMNKTVQWGRKIKVEKYRNGLIEFTRIGVLVTNISQNTTVDTLKSLFSQCGELSNKPIRLIPFTIQERAFKEAEIYFDTDTAIESALKLTCTKLNGRTLFVRELVRAKVLKRTNE